LMPVSGEELGLALGVVVEKGPSELRLLPPYNSEGARRDVQTRSISAFLQGRKHWGITACDPSSFHGPFPNFGHPYTSHAHKASDD